MNNSRTKKLFNNSILFAIGNLGSKFIGFLMLPLYTWKLSQSGMGVVDLVQTTASLILPIFSLSIYDAVLRFLMDKNSNSKEVFSNSFVVLILSCIFLLVIFPLLWLFKFNYAFYLIIILILQAFQSLFSQYAKAIDKIKLFAINGIFLSVATAVFNIIFLISFNSGVEGYLWSLIIANLFSNFYLGYMLRIDKEIEIHTISIVKIKSLLAYSLPLIPNSISFWVTNTVSRYFILFFLGVSANGIFSVAYKIPTLLGVLNSIFFQAWQLSAIEEFDSKDKSDYYSKIFSLYSKFIFCGASGVLLILKPFTSIAINQKFATSWEFVPLLLMGVVYSSFSGFLGNYYAASRRTAGAFNTTIYGAIINVICNFVFIPLLGLQGAGLSSLVSFLFLWILRQVTTQSIVKTKLNIKNILLNNLIIYIQIALLFLLNGTFMYVAQLFCLFSLMIVNKELFTIFKLFLGEK